MMSLLLNVLVWPIRLLYRLFIAPLDRLSAARAERIFLKDIEEAYASLLKAKGGTVSGGDASRSGSYFDYTMAGLNIGERSFRIVRGRYEFRVDMRWLGSEFSVFEESMPTSSGREGGDGGALVQSALFLERCWEQIPDASYLELRAMRNQRM